MAIRLASAASRRLMTASAEATMTTMIACPISTPRLKEKSDTPSARSGSPVSRSTLAKPKPCTRPNASATHARTSRPLPSDQQVVRADKDDAEGNRGFDDARRRVDDLQRRQRQRDAVADCEGRDDRQQSPEAAAEQQQADDEENVVGPDGDVVDTRGREGLEHGEETLT